tara:strand:+ start:3772 stop:4143 length:372 start_codon:yes stop_codon:yes gene_type:complete
MSKIIMFFSYEMILSICFFIAGHTMGWFAGNSQFVWEFWKDKPILATLVFGIPAGLLFWYGTKYCFEATGGELWSVRFIAAVFSYVTFPIMTWYFLGESIFTPKTMICIFLAMSILLVQMYYN